MTCHGQPDAAGGEIFASCKISFMAKLSSAPLYPVNLTGGGIPVNLVLNKTPEGKFQIAKVNKPGGPQEADFDVLGEFPDEHSAREYARAQVEKDFPGLL